MFRMQKVDMLHLLSVLLVKHIWAWAYLCQEHDEHNKEKETKGQSYI
jgi:hypothetical protein